MTRRRAQVPFITDELDPERAIRVLTEFLEICGNERLHLNTGANRFIFFHQVLFGEARKHCDDVLTAHGAGRTMANFTTCVNNWIAKYIDPTGYARQYEYFNTTVKPFKMTVAQTSSRFRLIVGMMIKFLNSPNTGNGVYDDNAKKTTFLRMMPTEWQTNFDATGHQITDAACTYEMLISFMKAQERADKKRRANREQRRGCRGGRTQGSTQSGRRLSG